MPKHCIYDPVPYHARLLDNRAFSQSWVSFSALITLCALLHRVPPRHSRQMQLVENPPSIYSCYARCFFCGPPDDSSLLRLGVSCGVSLSENRLLDFSLDWLLSFDVLFFLDWRLSLDSLLSFSCLSLDRPFSFWRWSFDRSFSLLRWSFDRPLSFSRLSLGWLLSLESLDLLRSLPFDFFLDFSFDASSGSCFSAVELFSMIVPPRTCPRRNPLISVRRACSCLAIVDRALRGTVEFSV